MQKGNQSKDGSILKGTHKIYLNNSLKNNALASNDAIEHKNLNSLHRDPIQIQQTRSPDLQTIKNYGFDEAIHETHLELDT